jgi:integrase
MGRRPGLCGDAGERRGDQPLPHLPGRLCGQGGYHKLRLSGIRFAHRMRNLADPPPRPGSSPCGRGSGVPTAPRPSSPSPDAPRAVGRCRPLPDDEDLESGKRPPEADLAGLRDRALLLVGFVAALRRSELAALTGDRVAEHPNGLVLAIARSKTNQTAERAELAVLPRARIPTRCPVTSLHAWLTAAGITEGPVFRAVSTGNRPGSPRMTPSSINVLVQTAVARAGLDPLPYSAHSLRAGFVTYAHLRGASGRAIAHQTRHRSLATLGQYVRVARPGTTTPPPSSAL